MKRIRNTLAPLMLCFAVSINAQAQEKTRIDVKTPKLEKWKPNLSVAKSGTSVFLRMLEWVEVVQWGENYCVWLKNYHRSVSGDEVTISFDVELRTRADCHKETPLASRSVEVEYNWREAQNISWDSDDAAALQNIAGQLGGAFKFARYAVNAGSLLPKARLRFSMQLLVVKGGLYLLEKFYSEAKKVEAIIVGAQAAEAVVEMFQEVGILR